MNTLPKIVKFCNICVQSNQRPGPSPEHKKKINLFQQLVFLTGFVMLVDTIEI